MVSLSSDLLGCRKLTGLVRNSARRMRMNMGKSSSKRAQNMRKVINKNWVTLKSNNARKKDVRKRGLYNSSIIEIEWPS